MLNDVSHGSDDIGEFKIKGRFRDAELQFKKQYIGKHHVVYKGKCEDSGKFFGQWNIDENTKGDFKLKCDIPKWKGHYVQDGDKHNMH